MELTPEERQRIYEEEKARLDAQRQIKGERSPASYAGIPCAVILGIVLLLMVIGFILNQEDHEKWQQLTPEQKDAQTLKSCLDFERDVQFKTYSELSEDERRMKYTCDVFISTGEFPGKRE
jgi:hypothetical protein